MFDGGASVKRTSVRRGVILAALWLGVGCAVLGANAIKIAEVTAAPGRSGLEVPITIDNDEPVWAISFAARYDTTLDFKGIALGDALGPGGVNAEWFEAIEGGDYFGAAVIVDFEEPYNERTLPAGTDQEAFVATFDVPPGGTCGDRYVIDLRSDLGDPPIKPVFTVVPSGGDKITESRVPSLVDGAVIINVPPQITSITPQTGNTEQETEVVIIGSGFSPDTEVVIGGQTLVDKRVESSTRITGKAPRHSAGVVDVVVSNSCGIDTLQDAFEYKVNPAIITAVTPRWGDPAGGTPVVLTGQNFSADTSIFFGNKPLVDQNFISQTEIRGKTPPNNEGPVDVIAIKGGVQTVLEDGFTYIGQPRLDSVQPSGGDGDEDVHLFGANFTGPDDPQFVLMVGAKIIPKDAITLVSSTELIFHMPACEADGWLTINLTTSAGIASLPRAYQCGGGATGNTFRRGDANCDNSHDIADAILILGYLFGGKTVVCLDALDTNDSGSLDLSDAIYLLGYFFAGGSPPPDPFPNLGPDPTDDELDCAQQCGS